MILMGIVFGGEAAVRGHGDDRLGEEVAAPVGDGCGCDHAALEISGLSGQEPRAEAVVLGGDAKALGGGETGLSGLDPAFGAGLGGGSVARISAAQAVQT